MKLFGIGLSRTATHSLNQALCMLGYEVVHYPDDDLTAQEVIFGRPYSILEHCDGITDTHAVVRYRELDQQYPKSKFILTVRDLQSWLVSCRALFERLVLDDFPEPYRSMSVRLRVLAYGGIDFEPKAMARTYRRHLQDVHNHFFHRPADLLVMNILAGDGWLPLCKFLGKPVPPVPFPRIK
jgi:hypothetical protein